ncbi:MAG: acetate--CoA ligase family protein, partial [Dehalobacterium sp.]
CVIAVPAADVVKVATDCVEKGIPVAQILTSGFGESGQQGHRLENQLLRVTEGTTRLVGPNCIGIYSTPGQLNFVAGAEKSVGKISIASQSGGLSIDMLSSAKTRGLYLNKLISIGNCLDLDPVDFLRYFGQDPDTDVIGFYLEGLRRGREFIDVLNDVCRIKPVVILKGGRTSLGSKSAASHTNSLAGEHAIWQSAIAQAGGINVESVEELLSTLTALQSFVPRPTGKGIAFVGNGGGNTVLATDLLAERGLTLASLAQNSKDKISVIKMPAGSTVGNPTDTPVTALSKSGGEAIGQVVNELLQASEVGGLVLHFNLLPFINYENRKDIADSLCQAILAVCKVDKPVYVALYGNPDQEIEELRIRILDAVHQAQLPCFQSIGEAVKVLAKVYHWMERKPQNITIMSTPLSQELLDEARTIITNARKAGCKCLTQEDAFRIINLFGIPSPEMMIARNQNEAVTKAAAIGFPVVMKIDSADIIHKTEVDGVRIGLQCEKEILQAYKEIMSSAVHACPSARINGVIIQAMESKPMQEMICGLKQDAVFGSVIVLGCGGILVELLRDVSMRVLPLRPGESAMMWRELKVSSLLNGYRGRDKADTKSLEDLIQRVASIGFHLPEIAEMDLNPVMVNENGRGIKVVDSRIIIKDEANMGIRE